MFKNLDKSEESVDTVDKTKTRIVNNTVAELISAEINHTTKKTTAKVQRKEGNPAPKKLNAKETITEEPPKTPTKQVYQNTDIDMLCTPGSLNKKKIALAQQNGLKLHFLKIEFSNMVVFSIWALNKLRMDIFINLLILNTALGILLLTGKISIRL